MTDSVQYQTLDDALRRLGYPQDAAEYHGALSGALCVRPADEVDVLNLFEPEADAAPPPADAEAMLAEVRDDLDAQLMDEGMSFAPLLPTDDIELPTRVAALISWCEGFLYGIASQGVIDFQACSEEAREAIGDIADFTRASLDAGDDAEHEEQAYTELVEYLRVAAQMLFLELRGGSPAPAPTVH